MQGTVEAALIVLGLAPDRKNPDHFSNIWERLFARPPIVW
jgi:hypothetical protein